MPLQEQPQFRMSEAFYTSVAYSVYVLSGLAIIFNMILFYIVKNHSKYIGNFKYLLMVFAVWEGFYALSNFLTVPMCYGIDDRVIIFSYSGLWPESLSNVAISLYCVFFEIWLGLVTTMFIYKYITVCGDMTIHKFYASGRIKILCGLIYSGVLSYNILCGTFICTRDLITPRMKDAVIKLFGIKNVEIHGYYMTSYLSADNSISFFGILSISNHVILLGISASIIFFCGTKMWTTLQQMSQKSNNCKRQKQVFLTICIQALTPIITYQTPVTLILGYVLFFEEGTFGAFSPMLTPLTTIPTIVDPLIILFIIRDYRRAVLRYIGIKQYKIGGNMTTMNNLSYSAPSVIPQ